MRALIQRVSCASVKVEGKKIADIKKGLLVFVGFTKEDAHEDFHWLVKKIIHLRVFNDVQGVMNLSLKEVKGELLIVSQFTLYALTKKGNRPSYMLASPPEDAKKQYYDFIDELEKQWGKKVSTGIFGADMKVELLNDGPVTIFIDSKSKE